MLTPTRFDRPDCLLKEEGGRRAEHPTLTPCNGQNPSSSAVRSLNYPWLVVHGHASARCPRFRAHPCACFRSVAQNSVYDILSFRPLFPSFFELWKEKGRGCFLSYARISTFSNFPSRCTRPKYVYHNPFCLSWFVGWVVAFRGYHARVHAPLIVYSRSWYKIVTPFSSLLLQLISPQVLLCYLSWQQLQV